VDRHAELVDPAGQDLLEPALRQREAVVVPGREVGDVERDVREPGDLHRRALREEPVGDAALVEHLDGARVQPARADAEELLRGAPLDDGDVDAGQRQLAGEHQPGRTAAGDDDRG
jgi:hypothetical protein